MKTETHRRRRFPSSRTPFNGPKIALLSALEEKTLGRLARDGDSHARDRLILANQGLVGMVAKGYLDYGLSFVDLVQEGTIGLIHAVDRYDPERCNKFCTYAAYWIRQAITRALDRGGRNVKLPSYLADLLSKVRRRGIELSAELGRTATFDEIADSLELTPRRQKLVERGLRSIDFEVGEVDFDRLARSSATDAEASAVDDVDLRQEIGVLLGEYLPRLKARQSQVLKLRYGLDGEPPLTQARIGERLGLTRARVHQIESKALARLAAVYRLAQTEEFSLPCSLRWGDAVAV